MARMDIKNRIKRSVANRKEDALFTSDFASFGSKSAVSAALRALVEEEFLFRVSVGVYAKSRWNNFGQMRVPAEPLSVVAPAALLRMGRTIRLGRMAQDYVDGKSTQVPNKDIYEIGNQRITRKFRLYEQEIYYEKNGKLVRR